MNFGSKFLARHAQRLLDSAHITSDFTCVFCAAAGTIFGTKDSVFLIFLLVSLQSISKLFFFVGPTLPKNLHSHSMIKHNKDLVVIGGQTNSAISSTLYRLEYKEEYPLFEWKWYEMKAKLKIPRYSSVASIIPYDLI